VDALAIIVVSVKHKRALISNGAAELTSAGMGERADLRHLSFTFDHLTFAGFRHNDLYEAAGWNRAANPALGRQQ
jgi:hypothetical protein